MVPWQAVPADSNPAPRYFRIGQKRKITAVWSTMRKRYAGGKASLRQEDIQAGNTPPSVQVKPGIGEKNVRRINKKGVLIL